MSDMVKYRAALSSFLKLTALVFYHVWHSPFENYLVNPIHRIWLVPGAPQSAEPKTAKQEYKWVVLFVGTARYV